ncbi:MAG: hypothetical protein ACYDB7_10085 [Mycobacteriales bacterium]
MGVAAGLAGAAGAALLAAAGALGGPGALVAVLLAAQLLLGAGWLRVLRIAHPLPPFAVVALAAVAADVSLVLHGGTRIGPLASVIALCLPGAFAVQLVRRDRGQASAVVAAVLSGGALAAALATLLALHVGRGGPAAVTCGCLAAAAVCLLGRGLPGWPGAVAAVGGAAGVGALAGATAGTLGWVHGLVIGLAAGVAGVVAGVVAAGLSAPEAHRPGRREVVGQFAVAALLPVAAASPAAYLAGRLLLG